MVFLVRHAERADDAGTDPAMAMHPVPQDDPSLSAAGRERAMVLARMLRDVKLTRIYTTDYRRTRETVAPTSEATGLAVAIYDASDPEGFASQLRMTPGRYLVVGHSNTTPALVEALGGDPGEPIGSLEYDRLYILTLRGSSVSTVVLRFGKG